MLTKLIAGIVVTDALFSGEGLFKASKNIYENFRQSVGIKDPGSMPDKKIEAIRSYAAFIDRTHPLKYSNIFGFYIQNGEKRYVLIATAKLGNTVGSYDVVPRLVGSSAGGKDRLQQFATYFNNMLKRDILTAEQRKEVQAALKCIELGKFDQAIDTYFSMKWIAEPVRVALVHIMYHAQDINIASVHIEKDERTGRERVVGLRPNDRKVCEFVYNPQTPALSMWTMAGR